MPQESSSPQQELRSRPSTERLALSHELGAQLLRAWGLDPQTSLVSEITIRIASGDAVEITLKRLMNEGEAGALVRILETYHLELDRMEPVEEA